jgi:hypothetical protein
MLSEDQARVFVTERQPSTVTNRAANQVPTRYVKLFNDSTRGILRMLQSRLSSISKIGRKAIFDLLRVPSALFGTHQRAGNAEVLRFLPN